MTNKQKAKIEIYSAMDSFLVETDKPRSISQLNEDRHLFVERMEKLIEDCVDEAMDKVRDYEVAFCSHCVQMTNHLVGVCQKCKDK